MGARVRLSEKEAVRLGLIPDPKLANHIPEPEPYRVPADHDWSTGPSIDAEPLLPSDDYIRSITNTDNYRAVAFIGGWLAGIATGYYLWGMP